MSHPHPTAHLQFVWLARTFRNLESPVTKITARIARCHLAVSMEKEDRLRRDRRCLATAEVQHGVFNMAQAKAAGHSRDSLHRMVRNGLLTRAAPRIFLVKGSPPSWMQDAMIAALQMGPASALSHGSAAALFEIYGYPRAAPIHVSVPGQIPGGRRPDLIHPHRGGPILVQETGEIDGIPVTSARLMLLDLAGSGDRRLEKVLDECLRRKLASVPRLWLLLEDPRLRQRRNRRRLEELVRNRTADADLTDSGLEVEVADALIDAGYPPVLQHPIELPDGTTIHIDIAFPEEKVAIETDGYAKHGDREAFDNDRWRDRSIAGLSWLPARVTWAHWTYDRKETLDSLIGLVESRRHLVAERRA